MFTRLQWYRWVLALGLSASVCTSWTVSQDKPAEPKKEAPKAEAKPPVSKEEGKKEEAKKADPTKATSKITVLVPTDSSVELKIGNQLTRSEGDTRKFTTPELDKTKVYSYEVSAVIEPNNYTRITRNRTIEFKGGEEVVVDLRNKLPGDKEDVKIRWVPTPEDIVEEMGKLAGLGKNDTVIDLGCGDAIMLITAVKKFGVKKAFGVDIDPKMVETAAKSVEENKLKEVVEIKEGNILKMESLYGANVVMVYLGDYMMDQLKPTFLKYLKPGDKIVSHRFIMSDWKADKSITVVGKDGDEYNLHLWIVPEPKK